MRNNYESISSIQLPVILYTSFQQHFRVSVVRNRSYCPSVSTSSAGRGFSCLLEEKESMLQHAKGKCFVCYS